MSWPIGGEPFFSSAAAAHSTSTKKHLKGLSRPLATRRLAVWHHQKPHAPAAHIHSQMTPCPTCRSNFLNRSDHRSAQVARSGRPGDENGLVEVVTGLGPERQLSGPKSHQLPICLRQSLTTHKPCSHCPSPTSCLVMAAAPESGDVPAVQCNVAGWNHE